MKTYYIFKKNLRVLSRNWSYLIILILCPIFLILLSGTMLNSSDFNNLNVGIVGDYSLGFGNYQHFKDLSSCLNSLFNGKISVCLNNNQSSTTIYLDNTQKIVENYAKQFVLQKVLNEQSLKFIQTSEEVSSKISIFSSSLDSVRLELSNAYGELDRQERLLVEYRQNLSNVRAKFNTRYYELKRLQTQINSYRQNIQDLRQRIASFNESRNNLTTSLTRLRNAIISNSSLSGYSYLVRDIDTSLNSLNQINNDLYYINSGLNSYDELMRNFDSIMADIEEIKILLDRIDVDLADAIYKVQQTKIRISSFKDQLDQSQRELTQFSREINSRSPVSLEFKSAFSIIEDPVRLAFPILISIIITFTSVILSNMFILDQLNKRSSLKEMMTPTGDFQFLIANYLVSLFFIVTQVVTFFFVGNFWFGINFHGDMASLSITIFLTASIFILMGISLAYIISLKSISMMVAVFLVMLFFIFSDLLTPIVLIDPLIRQFIDWNPFVISTNILFKLILLSSNIADIAPQISRLVILLSVMMVITYISKKISNMKAIR